VLERESAGAAGAAAALSRGGRGLILNLGGMTTQQYWMRMYTTYAFNFILVCVSLNCLAFFFYFFYWIYVF
jgi:hypothetical protein